MIILNQDSSAMYDFDKFSSIYIHGDTNVIYILNYGGNLAFPLGEYETRERCEEVIKEIFALMECTSKYDMPYV